MPAGETYPFINERLASARMKVNTTRELVASPAVHRYVVTLSTGQCTRYRADHDLLDTLRS